MSHMMCYIRASILRSERICVVRGGLYERLYGRERILLYDIPNGPESVLYIERYGGQECTISISGIGPGIHDGIDKILANWARHEIRHVGPE